MTSVVGLKMNPSSIKRFARRGKEKGKAKVHGQKGATCTTCWYYHRKFILHVHACGMSFAFFSKCCAC